MQQGDNPPAGSRTAATRHGFEFTGNGREYFKIWIVNILLSILTLGIYSAWAKVRTRRYFYGNTLLDGSRFEYHARPLAILKGRIIAVTLLLLYAGLSQFFPLAGLMVLLLMALFVPWVIWKSLRFTARASSYRNVRFSFDGTLGQTYKYFFWIPGSILITAGLLALGLWLTRPTLAPDLVVGLITSALLLTYLLYPWFQRLFTSFYLDYHRYGQGRFQSQLETGEYYVIYLLTLVFGLLITAGVGLILALTVQLLGHAGLLEGLQTLGQPDPEFTFPPLLTLVIVALLYLPLLVLGSWLRSYFKASLRNHVYSSTRLDHVLLLRSDMGTWRLFLIYVSNTVLVLLSLGLAYPWARIRLARYSARCTSAILQGSLDGYVTRQQEQVSAVGEELGDAFDVDVDMGLGL
ncbi:MAG TPA: YjgN family protein [Thiolinea sp.]|nr:YjgN family protein [Thiolinea sp.]